MFTPQKLRCAFKIRALFVGLLLPHAAAALDAMRPAHYPSGGSGSLPLSRGNYAPVPRSYIQSSGYTQGNLAEAALGAYEQHPSATPYIPQSDHAPSARAELAPAAEELIAHPRKWKKVALLNKVYSHQKSLI